ncbi:MAG: diguanylate cyclase [Proteobacteria bacterium]|nr:diguanylate cyclase [Pseudomonadota bacterium]
MSRPKRISNDTTQVIRLDQGTRARLTGRKELGTLTLLTGANPGAVYTLDKARTIIGRSPDAEIRITDEGLSRRHACVIDERGCFFVEDTGSTNGTYLNGERISQRRTLNDGDRIQVGGATVLRFDLQDALEQNAAKQVYESTLRDPLTGVQNRRSLDQRLRGEFAFAVRHGSPLAVMVIDIDHFKRINDTEGHQAGDAVLRSLATMLQQTVRTEDMLARYGGEEFLVVARGIDREGVAVLAERLRRSIEKLSIAWAGTRLSVTVSIGVSCMAPDHAVPGPETLVAQADAALYRAKNAGRNRVELA